MCGECALLSELVVSVNGTGVDLLRAEWAPWDERIQCAVGACGCCEEALLSYRHVDSGVPWIRGDRGLWIHWGLIEFEVTTRG